jgi:outer membrane receptor protein involved in Fe transport
MTSLRLRPALLLGAAAAALVAASPALAQTTTTAPTAAAQPAPEVEEVVVTQRATRSAVSLGSPEIQKLLPGISPLKAIQTLPGVLYETADPWGNNEQNLSLFVHGFSTQQLGFTMDGVPLGDQQYGNYNGLSPTRAVSSENVSRVTLSSGAGALGVASTSNLGGAIETFSRDPAKDRGADVRQTFGSYDAYRTFLRFDTGEFGNGNSAYVSYLRQDQRAWDFDGHQKGDQVNAKFVHEDSHGKLTLYADWNSKIEPNEDATSFGNQQTAAAAGYTPYTRPFIYPNYAAGIAYLQGGLPGSPPVSAGNNFTNYFSAAQRDDDLVYAKYDWKASDTLTWSNQVYGHYDYGRGIVAGPINQAGLPGLFGSYFPGLVVGGTGTAASLQNLVNLFGGTGYEVRTTEYSIKRGGIISTLDWTLGAHQIEAGLWYEHNESTQHRVWYPFSAANNDLTPYDVPRGPAVFEQYAFRFETDDVQFHLQDQWRVLPNLLLQAGFKSSLQTAKGTVLIQQKNLPTANPPTLYPSGSITSNEGFLPQFGALWDVTPTEQVFANVQKNLRQFIPYGAGSNFYGSSPWSLGSQAAFELFKQTVQPEHSWTYEVGVRTNRPVSFGPITSIQGQVNYYHVDFSNRLFNIAAYNFINPGASILVNVGGVTTDGVDLAATLNFGPHFHIYDGVSYNKSTYDDNYLSGASATVVPIAGKSVPLTPNWLNKTIASANFGPIEGQVSLDYVGERYVTYLNDLSVKSTFLVGLEGSYTFDAVRLPLAKSLKITANITNLFDQKGVSTAVVTGASGGYQAYPLPPRMGFVTLSAAF